MAASAVGVRVKKKVYDSPEELKLVHAAKRGDQAAFDTLCGAYQTRVFITINRKIANEDVSRWIANNAMFKIWKNLSRFKEKSKFSTWITRIAINEALMHLRSERRRHHDLSLDSLLEDYSREKNHTERHHNIKWMSQRDLELEGVIDRQLLEHAIDRVPEQFRRVLRLKFWEGLSMDEIQQRISIEENEPVSLSAVKSRILRGRTELKKLVEQNS